MSETTKCGTGCITPSVCHPFFCNRRADGGVQPSPSPATPPLAADHAQARETEDVSWSQSMDARVWADKFAETLAKHPQIAADRDTMLGWFANAIMAGYDEAQRRNRAASPGEGREADIDANGWLYDAVDRQYEAMVAAGLHNHHDAEVRCGVANLRNANRILRQLSSPPPAAPAVGVTAAMVEREWNAMKTPEMAEWAKLFPLSRDWHLRFAMRIAALRGTEG